MSIMTASTTTYMDNVAQSSSPVSPTTPFQSQQPTPSRSFINLNPSARLPPTPTTPAFLDPPPGVAYSEYIRTWTDNHVARWLTDIKCGSHSNTFKANDIRGDVLLELDQITLKEMGVASIGDRLRIVNAVKVLRQKSAASTRSSTPILDGKRHGGSFINTEHSVSVPVNGETSIQSTTDGSSSSRLHSRRLEVGRPAPLQLNSSSRNDLPRLVRDGAPDSARINHSIRPLPQPAQGASGSNPSSIIRPNLPPLPPAPRTQPPNPPPSRTPPRATQMTGRRTPTGDPPPYALLPTPPNQGLLTPGQSNNWTGYGLPSDPRPSRVTSPLPPMRGPPRTPNSTLSHGRNTSLSSPNSSTPTKLPPRPSTGNNSHPYAQSTTPGLQPPTQTQSYNLSPISESFMSQGTPSPPTVAYTVGRGPFNRPITPSAPSLDDLRRKLVKFLLSDEGHSCTINVADCAGGIEVLEKVLKKFGKASNRDITMEHVQTDEGGLSVDGWGVYLDWGQGDGPGEALTEAELLAICHAPLNNPARGHGLTLRRISKGKRSKALQMLEPRQRHSPTTPDRDDTFAPTNHTEKNTKRASSISILSGLGVRDPEKALEPASSPSTPDGKGLSTSAKKPSKLRNFFGQRPPSELITTHLTEYFPFTEKKVLERTARHSLMRSGTIVGRGEGAMSGRRESVMSRKRDSTISWNPPPPSRFSISTQGSLPRSSSSPTRTSFSSITPGVPDQASNYADSVIAVEDIPRVSISAEDGRPIEPDDNDSNSTKPQLLPPVTFPSESLAESMESLTGSRPISRAMSNASKRMSFITELRSKRDRSDTASLMTVDEITAEVESRRESMALDDWTKVNSEDSDSEGQGTTLAGEEADGELFDDEEATLSVDGEDEPGKPVTMKATKWIKGALIGAGSFGKVYLGMDASSGLLMAVKQVELPTGSAPNEERKKSMLSALEREIELLKDLQHDNIVQYLYSSLEDDYLNIFLEYVPGGSVTALLSNYGAFEEPLVKNFVRQILEGLNYLHERDIIHRDIKGANILVDNKGGIKISDFGISKKVEGNLLSGNRLHRPSLQGSVFWMAPEVVKQIGHTRKADIWSVGCLVVEMLTGEHPWAQLTQMQAIFKIGSSAKPTIPSDISPEAQDFLQRTFELDHEARPSAYELLQHNWISKKPAQLHKAKTSPSAVDPSA